MLITKMRTLITIIIAIFSLSTINSQSKKEIAYNFIRIANDSIENSIDYSSALINFNKALKYLETPITDKNIASLGARSYFETYHKQRTTQRKVKFLEISVIYSKQYFLLAKNKNSSDYKENMELYSMSRRNLKKLKGILSRKKMRGF